VPTTLLLAVVLLINWRAYSVDFAAECRYGGDLQTRFASYQGNYLRTLDREMTVYLLSDDVFRYGTHASASFLSKDLPVTNWMASVNDLKYGTSVDASGLLFSVRGCCSSKGSGRLC
jgi:hypothetical protein